MLTDAERRLELLARLAVLALYFDGVGEFEEDDEDAADFGPDERAPE